MIFADLGIEHESPAGSATQAHVSGGQRPSSQSTVPGLPAGNRYLPVEFGTTPRSPSARAAHEASGLGALPSGMFSLQTQMSTTSRSYYTSPGVSCPAGTKESISRDGVRTCVPVISENGEAEPTDTEKSLQTFTKEVSQQPSVPGSGSGNGFVPTPAGQITPTTTSSQNANKQAARAAEAAANAAREADMVELPIIGPVKKRTLVIGGIAAAGTVGLITLIAILR